jgi:cellulose synthase/poly-beta-1,6-N-acetylglucosamine synthase-like glycosyltransferase
VIIIDADCEIQTGTLNHLAQSCYEAATPVQAVYLMLNNELDPVKTKIAAFAFLIKNKIRPIGQKLLKMPCHLTGSGMAFPWDQIINANLGNANIVEDMQLGIDFVSNMKGPIVNEDIEVISYFPHIKPAIMTQRQRWEHGHLSSIMNNAFPLLKQSIKNISLKQLFFALDLLIPPFTLFLLLNFLMSTILWVIGSISNQIEFIYLGFYIVLLPLVSIATAWFFLAKDILKVSDIICIPAYMFSKISIYVQFFKRKQLNWVKTKRERED